MMNLALQIAKELGSSVITPEHIVLSVLKAKRGLAYEIFKSLNINEEKLFEELDHLVGETLPIFPINIQKLYYQLED